MAHVSRAPSLSPPTSVSHPTHTHVTRTEHVSVYVHSSRVRTSVHTQIVRNGKEKSHGAQKGMRAEEEKRRRRGRGAREKEEREGS